MLKTTLYLFAALQSPSTIIQDSIATLEVKSQPKFFDLPCRIKVEGRSICDRRLDFAKIEFFPNQKDEKPLFEFANLAIGRSKPDFRPGFAKIEFVPSDLDDSHQFASIALGRYGSLRPGNEIVAPDSACEWTWCKKKPYNIG